MLEKRGLLKIIYVMMDENYTTVTNPAVDGWLAMYIGDNIWYPLWNHSKVSETSAAIAYLISGQAAAAPSSPSHQIVISQSVPLASPSADSDQYLLGKVSGIPMTPHATSLKHRFDVFDVYGTRESPNPVQVAWSILLDEFSAKDVAALRSALVNSGVNSADDLIHISLPDLKVLLESLKPAKAGRLKKNLLHAMIDANIACGIAESIWCILVSRTSSSVPGFIEKHLNDVGISGPGDLIGIEIDVLQPALVNLKFVPRSRVEELFMTLAMSSNIMKVLMRVV